jgi:nicotinamide mononucleotide transporter
VLELAANAVTTLSIWLAVRNHVHTWTTGIVGCLLFMVLFYEKQLYADATLQVFFVASSLVGWWQWKHGTDGDRPVTKSSFPTIGVIALVALAVTAGYGWLLLKLTDDFMPFVDASVLILSVIAQCLLMQRKVESWPFWIAVNSLSVGLYISRGMNITAFLYAAYWFNAWYGWYRWRSLCAKV